MVNSSRPPAVILGGLANALSVARTLGREGVPVTYIGDRWASVRLSRYCTSFAAVEPGPASRYLDPLSRVGPGWGVVIPCGDDSLEFVATHRAAIEELGYTAIEANDDAMLAMLDKEQSYEIARAGGVPAPRTRLVRDVSDLREALAIIGVPSALKPRVSHEYAKHFAGKAIVVADAAEAEQTYDMIRSKGVDVVLTEIIPGPEGSFWGYYAYVDEDGARLFDFTKRKLRQYPLGFGLGTLHRMDSNPDVIEMGRRFVAAAGLRGLVNAEFKLDSRDGRYVFIECNHRLTAATALIYESGIDLAGFTYGRLIGDATPSIGEARTDIALWWPLRDTVAAVEQLQAGDLTVSAWIAGLRGRILLPVFSVRDPLPVLMAVLRSLVKARRHVERLVRILRR